MCHFGLSPTNTMDGHRRSFLCQSIYKGFWQPFRLKMVGGCICNHRMSKSSRRHRLTWKCGLGRLSLTAGTQFQLRLSGETKVGKQVVFFFGGGGGVDPSGAFPKCQWVEKESSLFLMKHAVLTWPLRAWGSERKRIPLINIMPLVPPTPCPKMFFFCAGVRVPKNKRSTEPLQQKVDELICYGCILSTCA